MLRRTLRSRPLRRAMMAYFVFNTAEWATYVALLVWAFDQGGAGAAGAIALIQLVPAAVVAPLGSVIGDRMRRSHALALGYALQAVTLLATAVALYADATFSVVAVAAATAACAITLTRPVHHALVPDIARSPAELAAGNSASTTVEGVAAFLGPAVSGVMLAGLGGRLGVRPLRRLVGGVGAAHGGPGGESPRRWPPADTACWPRPWRASARSALTRGPRSWWRWSRRSTSWSGSSTSSPWCWPSTCWGSATPARDS